MKITESALRQIIRKELLKNSNSAINEVDFGLTAGAAGVLAGSGILKRFFDKFRQSNVKKLTLDFIKSSSRLFEKNYSISSSITLSDIEKWSSQDKRLDKMGVKGFGGTHIKGSRKVKLLSTRTVSILDQFNHKKARNLFIEDTSFKFDDEDKIFFNKVSNTVYDPSNGYSGNDKFKFIDAMFYTMVRLYVKKYSSNSLKATKEIEKKISRIIGTDIKIVGRNSWETSSEYSDSMSASESNLSGPGRAIVSLPSEISDTLDYNQLLQIAGVQAEYGRNTTAFVSLPFSERNMYGIDLNSLTAQMRKLKHRWKFITNVLMAIKQTTKLAGSSSTNQFLEILLDSFPNDGIDGINREAVEFLVDAISKSNIKEGNLKEVMKLVVRIALS